MELTEVLKRLDYTISKAKELKPEQFDYSELVSVFDNVNKCGTVCCIAGHYPNWKIEGFFYEKGFCKMIVETLDYECRELEQALSIYHGISFLLIEYLFYGYRNLFPSMPYHIFLSDYTLPEVIQRFEHVRNLLASGEITPMQDF